MISQPYELASFAEKLVMYFQKSIYEFYIEGNNLICNEYKTIDGNKYIISQDISKLRDLYA